MDNFPWMKLIMEIEELGIYKLTSPSSSPTAATRASRCDP